MLAGARFTPPTPLRQSCPLASRSSAFLSRFTAVTQCSRLATQPCNAKVGPGSVQRSAGPEAASTVASAAQPLLHVVRRVAARTLPAWLAAARSLSSARVSPLLVFALVAYSVGVTIWATSSRTAATSSSTGSSEAPAADPSEGAAAVAKAAVAATLAPTAGTGAAVQQAAANNLQQATKDDGRIVCKVCNGSGEVFYDNHMESEGGMICPCCLGKGKVKKGMRGDLIQALLSFDP